MSTPPVVPTQAAPTAVPAQSKPRPKDPLMGTTEETYANSGTYYYAFGGEPLPDWSGLKDKSKRLLTDLCYRALDPVSGQKSTVHRTKSFSEKFERSHKLSDFQKKVWDKMLKFGLDTITYLPDPRDSSTVQSVITHHARFTGDLNKSIQSCQDIQTKFDTWDRKHDYEAREFLLESLSKEVREGFQTFHDEEDSFSATWLKLVHYLVTTTSKTYDRMKETIRSKRPQQYPGQDIEKMGTDFIRLAKELDNAGYYTHSLTLNMVDGFLCATRDHKGTFHHSLNSLRSKVSELEQETVFLSKTDQDSKFTSAKLSYRDVCLRAVKEYKELVHNNMWDPSKLPKDRLAPPSNVHLSAAQILNLIETATSQKRSGQFSSSSSKQRKCFNCGSPDHIAKDCPKPKQSESQSRKQRHASMAKWKLTAPKGSEPKSKQVNGRTFHWCQKCGNWTTTHDTQSHTGTAKSSSSRTPTSRSTSVPETNLTAWEPSAWLVTPVAAPPTSVWTTLLQCYFILTSMLLLGSLLLSPGLATFRLDAIHLLSTIRAACLHHKDFILSLLAPVTWFTAGFCTRHILGLGGYLSTASLVSTRRRRRPQLQPKSRPPSATTCRHAKLFHPRLSAQSRASRNISCLIDNAMNESAFNRCHPVDTLSPRRNASTRKGDVTWRRRSNRSKSTRCPHSSASHSCKCPQLHHKPVGVHTPSHKPNLKSTRKQAQRLKKMEVWTDASFTRQANKIALLSPTQFSNSMTSSEEAQRSAFPLIWDTGASICVTPDKSDFIRYASKSDIKHVKGLGGKKSPVVGQGIVHWSLHDTSGTLRHLQLQAYHIPSSTTRLISTSSLLSQYPGEHLIVDDTTLRLSGIPNDDSRTSVMAFNDPHTKLPTTIAYRTDSTHGPSESLCNVTSTVNNENYNLSESAKELLRWHQRLGHLAFKKIQHLMRTGVLSHTQATRSLHTAASKIITAPKCAACLFGKQTTRKSPGSITAAVHDRSGILRAGNLLPGAEVSVDHFVSSVQGRLFTGYDKGVDTNRYVGGCIFVDHASSYIHIEFQPSLSSHETLRAKLAYEELCRDFGIVIQTYMSDNGSSFTSKDCAEHLSAFKQTSKFAGVGAHHHNAQAERAIRTIMSIARTMMIHSGIHWPAMARATLWPMAVSQACYLYNHVPNHLTGLSPADLFTKTRWPHKRFHDLHVWGCPIYVLDKSIQDGKKIPKWKPRSSRSVYMGVSPNHASSVPLVLNVSTGSITPQFHVVFDDWFATVPATSSEAPDFTSNDWHKMFGDSRYQYVTDDLSDSEEADNQESLQSLKNSDEVGMTQDRILPSRPLPTSSSQPDYDVTPTMLKTPDKLPTTTSSIASPSLSSSPEIKLEDVEQDPGPKPAPPASPVSSSSNASSPQPRRSTRSTNPVKRLTYTHDKSSLTHNVKLISCPLSDYSIHLSSSAKTNPDLFTYDEAMNSEHRDEWIKAATKEIKSLEKLDCWDEIPLEEATEKVLPGTWVLRVKRGPDGSFKKWKARYCIRGDLQEGEFDTYAPVVSFSSVRLFLAWSLILDWYTCCIDFSNAFVQATLNDPTFIHLPRGFGSKLKTRTCLKLKKSIYGLSVAPRLWFQHLWSALEDEGLKQSKHDACLLLRKDLIIICYVDDLGIQAPNKRIVDELISSLENKGFELTHEGSFTEYLGIKYEKRNDGTIVMSQSGLISKILDATGMNDCNSNRTPTTREPLGSDPNGLPMEDEWNYRSVVGMLLYLCTNTRPDISFAVSQVARFSHAPKKSHASAVKTIVRYLSGTADQGVIYKRPKQFSLECFVDADFAGLYGSEPHEDPICVKSRTGYIVSVSGCYILCKSQLQTTIALSTSEAEYGALSQSMRATLPIRETILEIIESVEMRDSGGNYPFGIKEDLLKFKTTFHEDNSSALSLAVNQKITSRTKHWCVKSHFFWSHINDKNKNIQCVKVDTKEQRADYLTKGLTRDLFEHCRLLNQGW